uniref:Thioredoxin superfamily protein n=1 Tax=Sedum alfredii TaxID=439688 RepID=A0A8E4XWQ2_9MAGN|nr:thioredoxin superfamily protein [Sedum alfredii]
MTTVSLPLTPSLSLTSTSHTSSIQISSFSMIKFHRSFTTLRGLNFTSNSTPRSRRTADFKILAKSTVSGVVTDDVVGALGDVEIFRSSGESVAFKELWDQQEGLAVVALMRHFGCVCCWELATTLKEAKTRFDAAGVKLIAVGVGPPSKAQILAEKLPFPMECLYADPDRKAYNLLNLYYGLGRTFFNPASAKVFSRGESFKKALENYTIKATPDDISSVLQQGGMFVFKGKRLIYGRLDEGTGDHAPLDDVFEACCKLPVA